MTNNDEALGQLVRKMKPGMSLENTGRAVGKFKAYFWSKCLAETNLPEAALRQAFKSLEKDPPKSTGRIFCTRDFSKKGKSE